MRKENAAIEIATAEPARQNLDDWNGLEPNYVCMFFI